ncbi:NACHT, LRR and PYD domains-containing protein 12-like [Trichomycterus rosablanca]|uniref:NACHT, LRR and PYD domains-containing protein 12-like n=1 Tax=Trichomycterus rosablanca TaxID=2290929 RepID=UPI002F35D270
MELLSECRENLRSKLSQRCDGIIEGSSEIHTELYIIERYAEDVHNDREVGLIRTAAAPEKTIKHNDLFKDESIRMVLTEGMAGIGKTVSVQKFVLDWAAGRANQDVLFMLPLPFRKLNLVKDETLSLMNLLHTFTPEMKELQSIDCETHRVVFIFDGLDECPLPLNFGNNPIVCDVTEPVSVDALFTNLIQGNLLPSVLVWITSRPGAANQIPPEFVDQVTELRGFNDPQKEEYFRKTIGDENLASKIINHLRSSRNFNIQCNIPIFCWISATVLQSLLGQAEIVELPKTLTQMFTHFLIVLLKHKNRKNHKNCSMDAHQTTEMILALGKLAFQQLEKGNLMFFEEDLNECGIDVGERSVYSGVYARIFKEEFKLDLRKVFSFVHLSLQEFLAALYAFLRSSSNESNLSEFLNIAVDQALQSASGNMDLFLRFLLGLSLKTSETLQDLLTQKRTSLHNREETVTYIKEKIRENLSPEQSIDLFHCLNELNDRSLVQDVQTFLRNHLHKETRLSSAHWLALVFVLLNSEDNLDDFDLNKYDPSEEGLQKLLPVVKASRKVKLCWCDLQEESCAALSLVLCSCSTRVKDLDLSGNKVQDSGVKLLSAGLESPDCNLEILRLCCCGLTEESCAALSSVLSLKSSRLRTLDLSNNDLLDAGVKLLSAELKDPNSRLEILRLDLCGLTAESCAALSSVLSLKSSRLRELDLSNNDLQDSGVELLFPERENPCCNLEILRLYGCNLAEESCEVLSSVLGSNSSSLRELNLIDNKLLDAGVKLLSAGLQNPRCRLEILRLSLCGLLEESCASLSPVLCSDFSSLRELYLWDNKIQDAGLTLLSAGLENPHCKLEKLELQRCSVAHAGCVALASALTSNPSSRLRELNLQYNKPGESGVTLLHDLLKLPHTDLKSLHIET